MVLKRCWFSPFTVVVAVFLIQIIDEGCTRSIDESFSEGLVSGSEGTSSGESGSSEQQSEDSSDSNEDEGGNAKGSVSEETSGSEGTSSGESGSSKERSEDSSDFNEDDGRNAEKSVSEETSGSEGISAGGSGSSDSDSGDSSGSEGTGISIGANAEGSSNIEGLLSLGSGLWDILSGHATADGNNAKDNGIGDLIGSVIGGIFGTETSDGSARDDDGSTTSASGNITSIIKNIISSYGGLTNEELQGIIQILQEFQSGSTHIDGAPEVNSLGGLINAYRKYDLLTFLRGFAQYLVNWEVTVDNTKYGILDIITMPQKQLYKLIQYVIFQSQHLIESVARSILGSNSLIDTIFGFGDKAVNCVVQSSEDLPGIIGNDLVECVTGRINEIIQLVADAVIEIRKGLELLRNMVDGATGCRGIFCMGEAAGSTVVGGVKLLINVIGTVAHIATFAGTIFVQLPGCFVGSVTVTPGVEFTKMIGRMGVCMIS